MKVCISCHLNLSERAGLWRCARPHRQPLGVVLGLSRFLARSTAKERLISFYSLLPPLSQSQIGACAGDRVRRSGGWDSSTPGFRDRIPNPGIWIESPARMGDSLLGLWCARSPTHNARPLAKIVGCPQPTNLQFFIS